LPLRSAPFVIGSMVAECSQGTSFLLEGPSAHGATNHSSPETSGKIASGPAPSNSNERANSNERTNERAPTSEVTSQTLRSSPTRHLHVPLFLQPRWMRGREKRHSRDIEHRTRAEREKKKENTHARAHTRSARSEQKNVYFWSPQPKVSGYFSGETGLSLEWYCNRKDVSVFHLLSAGQPEGALSGLICFRPALGDGRALLGHARAVGSGGCAGGPGVGAKWPQPGRRHRPERQARGQGVSRRPERESSLDAAVMAGS
jgi:hypothetical protein